MKGFYWLLIPLVTVLLLAAWWGWQRSGLPLLQLGLGTC